MIRYNLTLFGTPSQLIWVKEDTERELNELNQSNVAERTEFILENAYLGPATGGATDWIKANTNTKYVFVLELPPDLSCEFK